MSTCRRCGEALESPLVCGACRTLQPVDGEPDPFHVLGLQPTQCLDAREVERRVLRLSRLVHPDVFATAPPEERELAERNTALLNGAREVLVDPVRRADHLVRSLGGPGDDEERQMPQEFLLEVLEWNEALEEARAAEPGSPERAAAAALRGPLSERRERCVAELESLLDPLPEPGSPALVEARRTLNAIRYLDRALSELEALRLEEAASR